MADLKEVCLLTQLATGWPLENVKGEGRQLAASRAAPCPGHLWAAELMGWRHVDGLGAGRRGPGGWSHAVGQGKGQGWSWPGGPSGEVAQWRGEREPPRLASRRVLGAQVCGRGSAGRLQGLVLGMSGLEPSPRQRRVSGWQPRSLKKAPGAEPSSWGFSTPCGLPSWLCRRAQCPIWAGGRWWMLCHLAGPGWRRGDQQWVLGAEIPGLLRTELFPWGGSLAPALSPVPLLFWGGVWARRWRRLGAVGGPCIRNWLPSLGWGHSPPGLWAVGAARGEHVC